MGERAKALEKSRGKDSLAGFAIISSFHAAFQSVRLVSIVSVRLGVQYGQFLQSRSVRCLLREEYNLFSIFAFYFTCPCCLLLQIQAKIVSFSFLGLF